MSAVKSQARVTLGQGTVIEVDADVHLNGNSDLYCFTYEDRAPVLVLVDAGVRVSLTVPDLERVTGEDVKRARELAELVGRYVAELEKRAAGTQENAAGAGVAA